MSKGKIFNAQEVQAIIAGNKTQFRAICKRQPQGEMERPCIARQPGITEFNYPFGKIPYKVGQKIFVKESFGFQAPTYGISEDHLVYKSDNPIAIYATSTLGKEFPVKWKPASQMKQEDSRLTLQITEIDLEQIRDLASKNYECHWVIKFEVKNEEDR